MKHVVLAKERRRRKQRIKGIIFFMAFLSLLVAILLAFKNQDSIANQAQEYAISIDDIDAEGVEEEVEEPIQGAEENALADADDALDDFLDVTEQAMEIKNQFSHTIVRGETLRDVLELSGIEGRIANRLIAENPNLKHLKAGQQIYWTVDKEGNLESFNWVVSDLEERVFTNNIKGDFVLQKVEKESHWQRDILKGQVAGSLSKSLRKLGLSRAQANQLITGLQWETSVKKLKKGDKFSVLVRREYIDNKATELGNVEGIKITSNGKTYYAIQAEDGRYYSRNGAVLTKNFSRYPFPTHFKPRISSGFNPYRRHPVTGRVRPHNGTDFAIPVGTLIVAPADGVVEKVAYQPHGAGRYIKLKHSKQYTTIYMHLNRTLVKPGQTIKKGQRIAYSGNTGRSTGAHLHYELRINNRPVNAMRVKLPGGSSSSMSSKERKAFLQKAKGIIKELNS